MKFTIPFVATAAASSVATVCSGSIEFPHRILRLIVMNSTIANEAVRAKFFTAANNDTPSSGEPSGTSLVPNFAQTAYITVGAYKIDLKLNYFGAQGHYLKFYINNTDTVNSQTVRGYVEIEEVKEGEV